MNGTMTCYDATNFDTGPGLEQMGSSHLGQCGGGKRRSKRRSTRRRSKRRSNRRRSKRRSNRRRSKRRSNRRSTRKRKRSSKRSLRMNKSRSRRHFRKKHKMKGGSSIGTHVNPLYAGGVVTYTNPILSTPETGGGSSPTVSDFKENDMVLVHFNSNMKRDPQKPFDVWALTFEESEYEGFKKYSVKHDPEMTKFDVEGKVVKTISSPLRDSKMIFVQLLHNGSPVQINSEDAIYVFDHQHLTKL
jgi:hypothetical protein